MVLERERKALFLPDVLVLDFLQLFGTVERQKCDAVLYSELYVGRAFHSMRVDDAVWVNTDFKHSQYLWLEIKLRLIEQWMHSKKVLMTSDSSETQI